MPAPLELRPHQKEAVTAATQQLRDHRRTSIIAACGTGKTLIAARTVHRVAPKGRVLVLVPTLDLLSQTIRVWQAAGRRGQTVAVCSARQALDHEPFAGSTPMTTDPGALADHATATPGEPVTVYATYASLPVVVAAHRDHTLPAWDLAVIDEAHRTAGRLGKAWAAIHHDDQVPARRRLYLTATPRIWDGDDDNPGEPVASMDDPALFGPVAYRLTLSDAIDLGLLADYQILVPVIDDNDLRAWLATGPRAGADGVRLAGRQVALLRAIRDHKLRRVLTFHHRVADARAFATSLTETAGTLSEDLRPDNLWTDWISGTHSPQVRRRILLEFAQHPTAAPAVLSNARVLGEGIDVPAIDAVVFGDPKDSPIETVQAVGRALRQQPGASKKATLIVPVYATPGEDPDDLLNSSSYNPLWRTLQALRAHDSRLEARLADPRTTRLSHTDADPEDWLLFDRPARADDIALALSLHVLAPKSAEWRRGLLAARRYHRAHGHLDIAQTYIDQSDYPLGRWITWQRHLHRTASLDPARTKALDQLDMVWDPRRQAWERGLSHARAYAAAHGHLAVPVQHRHDDYPLGRWLATQRAGAKELPHERIQALDALDLWWNPPWSQNWTRHYLAARQHSQTAGTPDIPHDHQTDDGLRVGEWLHTQRSRPWRLHAAQRRLLIEAGLLPLSAKHADDPSWLAIEAARTFHAREGNLEVPRRHIENVDGEDVKLGTWVSNARRRRDGLSPRIIAALDQCGMRWSTKSSTRTSG